MSQPNNELSNETQRTNPVINFCFERKTFFTHYLFSLISFSYLSFLFTLYLYLSWVSDVAWHLIKHDQQLNFSLTYGATFANHNSLFSLRSMSKIGSIHYYQNSFTKKK